MSLIDAMMETFVIMNKTKQPDGEGGTITTWHESSTTFKGALTLDTSMQTRIAEKDGFTNAYTMTTRKNVELDFHDVIKRQSDGKYFRITSDGTDKKSPIDATIDMRQCSAELWRLT